MHCTCTTVLRGNLLQTPRESITWCRRPVRRLIARKGSGAPRAHAHLVFGHAQYQAKKIVGALVMWILLSEKEVSFLKHEILRIDKVRVLEKRKKDPHSTRRSLIGLMNRGNILDIALIFAIESLKRDIDLHLHGCGAVLGSAGKKQSERICREVSTMT